MQTTRGRGDTSALIASETAHPSSSELSEPFPTKSAYSKQARIYFSRFLRFSVPAKACTDVSSQLGDPVCRVPSRTVFGGGVDSSPSITQCINPVPPALLLLGLAGSRLEAGGQTPPLFVGSQQSHRRGNLQTWLDQSQLKGRIPT